MDSGEPGWQGSSTQTEETPQTRTQAKTLVIIPTYNEAGNIERLLREIHEEALDIDLLVVDDHSPDGTGHIVEALSAQIPLRVIHREGKLGIGSAHRFGFEYAMAHGYPEVVTMDADFAHQPAYLRTMLRQSASADVIVGSRYLQDGGVQGWSPTRLLITHTAHWLTTHVLRLPYDCTGGFRLYKTSVLRAVNFEEIRSEGYAFLIELLFHLKAHGCSILEIPIVINSRHTGTSKISRYEILKAVTTLIRLGVRRHFRRKRRGHGVG